MNTCQNLAKEYPSIIILKFSSHRFSLRELIQFSSLKILHVHVTHLGGALGFSIENIKEIFLIKSYH